MADGSGGEVRSEIVDVKNNANVSDLNKTAPAAFVQWLFRTSPGLFTLWAFSAFFTLVCIMVWHVFSTPILASPYGRTIFLSSTSLFWLPLILLLMDAPENLASGPRMRLPFTSLLLFMGLTTFAVLDKVLDWNFLNPMSDVKSNISALSANRIAFSSFFALAFIPLVWNAARTAIHDQQHRQESQKILPSLDNSNVLETGHDEDAEAMSALIATMLVVGVGTLAFFAGELGKDLSFPNSFGLFLCGAVIGIFAIVVFLEALSELPPIKFMAHVLRGIAKLLRPLAAFYDLIDAGLARIGAGVVGMNHHNALSRYSILVGILTCLSIMGWWLPAPLGLLPVSVAFILALSVSRLWSWVEDDRALAAMTEYRVNAPYRIGFREDFKDETLLGFIFVFALVPIAMMQAHNGEVFGPELFKNADNKGFLSWIGYFGVELAKAVPIVDWAEIYNVTPAEDLIQMNGPPSRHAVFLARVMVDLVLIASLLQALAISTRNRQQKRLYKAGHITRLDHFVERTEIERAIRLCLKKDMESAASNTISPEDATKCFQFSKLARQGFVDFRKYNHDRLRRIYGSEKDQITRNFILALSHLGHFQLAHAIDLVIEIAEGEKNEFDMIAAYQRAIKEHDQEINQIIAGDIYRILTALRNTTGLKELKFNLMDKLVQIGSKAEVRDILKGIQSGKDQDRFNYTKQKAALLLQTIK